MEFALSSLRMVLRGWLAAAIATLAVAVPAAAQETRAEILARQRAEKATQLRPYEPKGLEKTLLWIEETEPLRKIAPYNGFYVQYGYTGKPIGSGIAFGGGWRHDLFDRNARVVFEAGQSFRDYRMARLDFSLPRLAGGHFELGGETSYRYHPQEDFYGLGFDSLRDDRVSYLFRAPAVEGRAMVKAGDWLNAGARLGRMNVSVSGGTDSRFPSIEQEFGEADAPGLTRQPDFLYTDLFATLDTRDQAGNARDGTYIGLLWRRHSDLDFDRFSFDRVDLDAMHFLPIFDKKRVFAARFRLLTTTAADGQEVPFYFEPTIGGSDTLRSVADYRFRDRNGAVLNLEYRWEAFSGLDMALFSDFGTMAPRISELDSSRIRGAYGIGLRFNTYKAVFLRLDIGAGGSEGIRTFLKYSRAF